MSPGLFDDTKPSSVLAKGQFPDAALPEVSAPGSSENEMTVGRDGDHIVIRKRNKDGTVSIVRRSVKDGIDPELDQHFLKGDFKKTIEAADERLKKNDKDLSALWHKGESHAMLGQHDEAIEAFDKMLAINPEDASVINNKAISVGAKGNHDEALRLYARAHQLDPKSSIIAGNLASAHLDKGDTEEALKYAKIALDNGPIDEEHRKYLESIKASIEAIKEAPKVGAEEAEPVLA
jgi:Flp pilus assembly protein TadD